MTHWKAISDQSEQGRSSWKCRSPLTVHSFISPCHRYCYSEWWTFNRQEFSNDYQTRINALMWVSIRPAGRRTCLSAQCLPEWITCSVGIFGILNGPLMLFLFCQESEPCVSALLKQHNSLQFAFSWKLLLTARKKAELSMLLLNTEQKNVHVESSEFSPSSAPAYMFTNFGRGGTRMEKGNPTPHTFLMFALNGTQ